MSIRHPYDVATFTMTYHHPANPPAGTGYVVTIPNACRIEIISACFTFQSDATVADRYVYIAPNDGVIEHCHFFAERAQAASLIWHYDAFRGCPSENGIGPLAQRVRLPLGVGCIFDNVTSIIIDRENPHAGDQFSNLRLHYKSWYSGVPAP